MTNTTQEHIERMENLLDIAFLKTDKLSKQEYKVLKNRARKIMIDLDRKAYGIGFKQGENLITCSQQAANDLLNN